MGKLKEGLHGNTSGTTGNIVTYVVGGKTFTRTKAAGPHKFTENQRANHSGFKIKQDWINQISEFLKVGYRNDIPFVGGPALAMKYLSANAVSGKGKEMQVHPELMLVSMGDLPGAPDASAIADGLGVSFSWDPKVTFPASSFDQPLLLAYDVDNKKTDYVVKGHFRKDGSARLPISEAGNYHCYLGFLAEDHSQQSNSQYLGVIQIL